MSRQINQPINQVKLTNVAVVRMNRGGKRFEIACYRNKVVDYRQGLETDLSEVLQTERVFTNVSKGEFAKAKDLQKVFGTKDEEEIARMILSKGQVQVSDKERNQQLEKTNAQIAEWISKNCVQSNTDRPFTIPQIRHAMHQANFSVHPTKPLKRQYLDCVKQLQSVIPIHRAKMELLLLIPDKEEAIKIVEDAIKEHEVEWTQESGKDDDIRNYKLIVDPSLYRILNDAIEEISGAHIEIIAQVMTKQGDANLETELEETLAIGEYDVKEAICDPEESNNIPSMEGLNIVSDNEEENDVLVKSDDSDEVDMAMNRRRQQKKNKKKNRKAQRRDDSDATPTTVAPPSDIPSAETQFSGSNSQKVMEQQSDGGTAGDTSVSRRSCNTCGGSFDTPAAYRAHFKSDWHRFNQKLKLKGASPISEEEFKLCDAESFFGGIGDDIL